MQHGNIALVADRDALLAHEGLAQAILAAQERLRDRGRVLVRPSGTEPLVRVMVEAPTDQEAEDVCAGLVELVRSQLG